MSLLEMIKVPSLRLSLAIAFLIVSFFLFKTILIFVREGVFQHIKDDWTFRLPYRVQNNRYQGASRPSYVILCFLYYVVKDLFLLIFACDFYIIKFILWDVWKWLFRFEDRKWYKKIFYSGCEEGEGA